MGCSFQFLCQNPGAYSTDSMFHCLQLTSRLLLSSNGCCDCFHRMYSLERSAARRRVERSWFNTRGGRFRRPSSWCVVLEGSPSPACAPAICSPLFRMPLGNLSPPKLDAPTLLLHSSCLMHLLHEAPSPRAGVSGTLTSPSPFPRLGRQPADQRCEREYVKEGANVP